MKIGRISENILKRSVLQQIRCKCDEVIVGAGIGRDCAIFSCSEAGDPDKNGSNVTKYMMSCMQENFLDRGMRPLLQKCVNIFAARGGKPVAVSLSLLLPEDSPEELLRTLTAEADGFCRDADIRIVEAGGRVSKAVLAPYAAVSLYGTAPAHARAIEAVYHTVSAAEPGQDIVVSKWIGLEGTAILAKRHRETLLARYPAWLVAEAERFDSYLSTVADAETAIRSGARAIWNVSEGGVFAALWELAEGAGVGLTVELKKLPLRQETVEVCNHCNRNPYELLSGGSLLMTADDGEKLAAALEEAGIPAAVVGKITDSRDRLILNDDETRYLDRPHVDEIYRDSDE